MGQYVRPDSLDMALLPKPFVAGKEGWREVHDFSWRCAFDNIQYLPGAASPYFLYNALNPVFIWTWDTCFMSMFARYAPDLLPATGGLDILYSYQHEDGYISMAHVLGSGADAYGIIGQRVNPPLFAWAEWEYARTTGRMDRIAGALKTHRPAIQLAVRPPLGHQRPVLV